MADQPSYEDLQREIELFKAEATKSREHAEKTQTSARHLRAILGNINMPMFLKDSDYKYLLMNRQYEVLAHVTNDDFHGKTDYDIFPEPVAALFRSQDEEVVAKNEQLVFAETVPLPDGELSFITSKFPLHDDSGTIYAVGGVCTDVTALKASEEALRISENKFKSIIENSPMGVHVYALEEDDRLVFTGANPVASEILGVDCSQFVGKTLEQAFPPLSETEIPARYRQACRGAKPWHTENIEYADGRIQGAFEVHAFGTSPGRMAVFFLDVTKKRRLEEEMSKVQKLESIGVLAGGIAHDFNNILTSILGNISLAALDLAPDNDEARDLLLQAHKASQVARNLTRQLLTFSRGGEPVRKRASIVDVIKDSADFVMRGRNARCEYEIADDLRSVEIDTGQMSQVIQNILINASQAMPGGGIIQVSCKNFINDDSSDLPLPAGEFVQISISDTGVGIPADIIGRIFDPYFTTKQEGSGLGLAVTHSIVAQHGGHISATSSPGVGTTISTYVQAAEPTEPPQEEATAPLTIRAKVRVLIMDDEEMVATVAEKMCMRLGCEVEVARDGAEAIELYSRALQNSDPFELVIMDLTIPAGMGGKEAAEKILAIDPKARLIVSSGYSHDPVMANFRKHGFRAAIVKPYQTQDLCAVINSLLE